MESHPLTSAGSVENSTSLNSTEVKYRLHGQDSVTSSGSGNGLKPHNSTASRFRLRRLGRWPSLLLFLILLLCLIVILALSVVVSRRAACTSAMEAASNRSHAVAAPRVYRDLAGRPFPYQRIRLPSGTVLPITYDLFLFPELSRNFYSGNVTVLCACRAEADFVVMHALQLNVTRVVVRPRSAASWKPAASFAVSAELEQLFVRLQRPCVPGSNFSVNVQFESELTKSRLMGFYLSDYTKKDGTRM